MKEKIWDIWFDVCYYTEPFRKKLKQKITPYRIREVKKWIDSIVLYAILVVVVMILTQPMAKSVEVLYDLTTMPVEIENENIGKALNEVIKEECYKNDVPIELVYAIINTNLPPMDVPRYGIMQLHPDLLKKYKDRFAVSVVESQYSNVVAGIERLAWALNKNETIEGALMVYYYTQPKAQEMWKRGIKTTDWVEEVKGEL